jgi:hypothetical protein
MAAADGSPWWIFCLQAVWESCRQVELKPQVRIEKWGFPVADPFSGDIEVGPPPVSMRKRRSLAPLWTILFLLVLGAVGGFAWMNYDHLLEMTRTATAGSSGTPVLASAPENAVSTGDFSAFQQQTTSSIQSATDLLTAQQTELKRLSDQIEGLSTQVAGLAAKLDQSPGRPVAAAPTQHSAAPVAAPVAAAARQAPAAARKRPAVVARPAGAISVGGAPLPAQPAAR